MTQFHTRPTLYRDKHFDKHEDWIKTVLSRVYIWFSEELTKLLSFWLDIAYFYFWPRFKKDIRSDKVS